MTDKGMQLITLLKATRVDFNEIRKLLVQCNKEDLNSKDENGDTPLHWAASLGRVGVIEYLIKNGAKVNSANRFKCTASDVAASNGQVDSLKALFKCGANGINSMPEINQIYNARLVAEQALYELREEGHIENCRSIN